MISVSGRVMAGVVLATVIISGWFAWRLLWPPIPSDRGLAVLQEALPGAAVSCLLSSIEEDPERFFVDDSFYLEPPGDAVPLLDHVFYLRDRNNRHPVSFATSRTLSYHDFYGQSGSVQYGPC